MKKNELLKECVKVMQKPNVADWYAKKLETKPQSETIIVLSNAVYSNELTATEALSIALIVGVQWNEKFEGAP